MAALLTLTVTAGAGGWTVALLSGDNIVAIVLGFFTTVTSIATLVLTQRGNKEGRRRRVVVTNRDDAVEVSNEDLRALAHPFDQEDDDADRPAQ